MCQISNVYAWTTVHIRRFQRIQSGPVNQHVLRQCDDIGDVYNPLIPDGSNWKATFMIEYEDAEVRKQALTKMIGIERRVQIQVDGYDPVTPIANEDLERETEEKTSSVHFLRFELTAEMIAAAKEGAAISAAIDHPAYRYQTDGLPDATRACLAGDLD